MRALWWSDDAAVKSALIVRAERNAAPCGASHVAVAVEDGARATVGSAASARVSAGPLVLTGVPYRIFGARKCRICWV